MPNYQGKLDGLCGPYAISNAFGHCGVNNAEQLFQTSCKALAHRRWPNTLWEGTTLGDLKRMIKACRTVSTDAAAIKTSYPFSRNTPTSNTDYWQRFDQLFAERPDACCMILGITRPCYHWIVAFRESASRISFVDTDPHTPFKRKNRSMLFAGSRNGNPNKWIIQRDELILFEKA